jgi:hypothetical protein
MLFASSSCVEIIDDLSLNNDGSGSFKYTVNLSSSKVKINSILALDTLDGRKVPTLDEIKLDIDRLISAFEQKDGISEVMLDANYDDYMFKISCDFNSLFSLQSAIKDVIREETKYKDSPELDHDWLSLQEDMLERSVPQITIEKAQEIKQSDKNLLKEGSYTSITRFNKVIDDFKNQNAMVSKNGMAIMLKTNPYSLIEDHHLLDNIIYLKTDK